METHNDALKDLAYTEISEASRGISQIRWLWLWSWASRSWLRRRASVTWPAVSGNL